MFDFGISVSRDLSPKNKIEKTKKEKNIFREQTLCTIARENYSFLSFFVVGLWWSSWPSLFSLQTFTHEKIFINQEQVIIVDCFLYKYIPFFSSFFCFLCLPTFFFISTPCPMVFHLKWRFRRPWRIFNLTTYNLIVERFSQKLRLFTVHFYQFTGVKQNNK